MSEVENMPEPKAWLAWSSDDEALFFTEEEAREWWLAKDEAVGGATPLVSVVDYWKLAQRYDEAMKPWTSFGEQKTVTR